MLNFFHNQNNFRYKYFFLIEGYVFAHIKNRLITNVLYFNIFFFDTLLLKTIYFQTLTAVNKNLFLNNWTTLGAHQVVPISAFLCFCTSLL